MHTFSSHINGGSTMSLISGAYHSCERRKYAFMILWEYAIISREQISLIYHNMRQVKLITKTFLVTVYRLYGC